MRLVKKILLYIIALVLSVITGVGIYAWAGEKKLTSALIRKVNETINTRISYGDVRLLFMRSFPNITVKFTDILVSPSPWYDKTQFPFDDNDTLMYASSLSVSTFLPSLLSGSVSVRSISVRDGEITLLTDKRGDINYKIFSEKKKNGKSIRLRNISLRNINTVWHDRSADLRLAGKISSAALSGEIFRSGIFLNASASAAVDSVNLNELKFAGLPVSASVRMRKSANSISVARGSLEVADLKFGIDGNINYSRSTIDLSLTGKKVNIGSVYSLLPERIRLLSGSFSPSGIVDIGCTIKGPYGEAGRPHTEISYKLSVGRLTSISSGLRVNNLEFSGGISNGALNSRETFQCTVDNLSASFGSASLKGSFMLNSLVKPHISLALNGNINFNDLSRIMKPGRIRYRSGNVKGHVRLSGFVPDSTGLKLTALSCLDPDILLSFTDLGAEIMPSGLTVEDMNGSVSIGRDLSTDSLSFVLGGQHLSVICTMRNFIPWLAGLPETMSVSGAISADRFDTGLFAASSHDTDDYRPQRMNLFPSGVTARVNLKADSVISKGFRASSFSGNLAYRPFVYTLDDIRASALDGVISGEVMLGRHKGGGYVARSTLNVTDIDINKTFASFGNFGQTFIVSDNLHGTLTGSITLLAPLDTGFTVDKRSLVAEAHLAISDGRLVGFGPAESLSDYLDLDELRDISFSKLENDLFIKSGNISIPKMLINSSVVNFTVYGTHSFSGDYSYHVRLLLSEVLSRKARERNRNDNAFGRVQVDGTGKATIPLRIERIAGETGIGYDFGQAQNNIRNDIALEKQTLKGILSEEYGWYKSDTVLTRPVESKPHFTITWEEGKNPDLPAEPPREDIKESPLKGLFKKKR